MCLKQKQMWTDLLLKLDSRMFSDTADWRQIRWRTQRALMRCDCSPWSKRGNRHWNWAQPATTEFLLQCTLPWLKNNKSHKLTSKQYRDYSCYSLKQPLTWTGRCPAKTQPEQHSKHNKPHLSICCICAPCPTCTKTYFSLAGTAIELLS